MTKEENVELQKRIRDTNENGVLDSVSESWYNKLKCFMEGLEVENIDLLLATGKDSDYRRLGELMQNRIKELM